MHSADVISIRVQGIILSGLSGGVRMHSADVISIRVQVIILSGLSGSRFITMRVAYESYYYDEINSLIIDESI